MQQKSTRSSRAQAKHALPEEFLEAAAKRFRALAVPSRLRILNALMQGPLTVGSLAELTGLEQSNVSRQVTELERAGCVERTRLGRSVLVALVDPDVRALCELVCNALKAKAARSKAAMPRLRRRG